MVPASSPNAWCGLGVSQEPTAVSVCSSPDGRKRRITITKLVLSGTVVCWTGAWLEAIELEHQAVEMMILGFNFNGTETLEYGWRLRSESDGVEIGTAVTARKGEINGE